MVSRRPKRAGAGHRVLTVNLVVYIDFKSPAARLAIGPTRALADEFGVPIDWRPYNLKPRRRAGDANWKGAIHARVRAEYRQREQAFYARQQNIRFVQPTAPLDSFVANAGLLWATRTDRGEAYVEDVFERIWAAELDPSSQAEVSAALARAGCTSEGFEDYLANEAETALMRHADEALVRLPAVDRVARIGFPDRGDHCVCLISQ